MNLDVRFIAVEQTLPLRSRVLREGRPFEQCRFAEDGQPGSFHVGCFDSPKFPADNLAANSPPVGIASWYPQSLAGQSGRGFQLRGMAVAPELQRSGVGRAMLEFGERHLRAEKLADYLWCNARVSALGFYELNGWQTISVAFDIPEVGPHRKMMKPCACARESAADFAVG